MYAYLCVSVCLCVVSMCKLIASILLDEWWKKNSVKGGEQRLEGRGGEEKGGHKKKKTNPILT